MISIPTSIPRLRRLWYSVGSLLLLTALSPALHAQDPSPQEKTWYNVEMILFRQGGSATSQAEQWPQDIRPSYPLDWRVIAESDSDATADPEDPIANLPASRKLYRLPDSARQLDGAANKLQRSGRYRLLLHEAWQQGMTGYGDEPSIVITAGNQYGDHYELEGTITLKLQRYLHISTDLWLTDFTTNAGQEQERWPELPLAPWKPRKTSPTSPASSNYWTQFQVQSSDYDSSYSSQPEQPYIVSNIASIIETRRMRSNELHYVDHPLVGILIKFTPVKGTPADAPQASTSEPSSGVLSLPGNN